MKKRIISLFLTLCMVVSLFPAQIFATDMGASRQAAIDALAQQYGKEQAEAMFDAMVDMGLIDKEGNQLTYRVEMDGKTYTLDQMRPFVKDGVDLTKTVIVDGKSVTLDFIKKLLTYQDEMAYLESFFARQGKQLTEEHQDSLLGIANQFASKGIDLNPLAATTTNVARIKISYVPKDDGIVVTATQIGASDERMPPSFDLTMFFGSGSGDKKPETLKTTMMLGYDTFTKSQEFPNVFSDATFWKGQGYAVLECTNVKNGLFTMATTPSANDKPYLSIEIPYTGTAVLNLDGESTQGQATAKGNPFSSGLMTCFDINRVSLPLVGESGPVNSQRSLKQVSGQSYAEGWYRVPIDTWNGGGKGPQCRDQLRDGQFSSLTLSNFIFRNISGGANDSFPTGTFEMGFITGEYSGGMLARPSSLTPVVTSGKPYTNATWKYLIKTNDIVLPLSTDVRSALKDKAQYLYLYVRANNCSYSPLHLVDTGDPVDLAMSATLHDTTPPAATSITQARDKVYPGETAYFVVNYPEPVIPGNIMVNNASAAPVVGTGYAGQHVLYKQVVPQGVNMGSVAIQKLDPSIPTRDLAANEQVSSKWLGNTVTSVPTKSIEIGINRGLSITGMTIKNADGSSMGATTTAGEKKVELSLYSGSSSAKQNAWIIENAFPENGDTFKTNLVRVRCVYTGDNGPVIDEVTLTLDNPDNPTKLVGTFTMPEKYTEGNRDYRFNADIDFNFNNWGALSSYAKTITQTPVLKVTPDMITLIKPALSDYLSGTEYSLLLGDPTPMALDFTVKQGAIASYKDKAKDFVWASSDSAVLEISKTGQLIPKATGEATITLTATNGTDNEAVHTQLFEQKFTILAGGPSSTAVYTVPSWRGEALHLSFSTNIIANGLENNSAFEAFPLVTITPIGGGTPAWVYGDDENEKEPNITFVTVPENVLSVLSKGFAPSYEVTVTMTDYLGKAVSGTGGIVLRSHPATIGLTRPTKGYYVTTDDGALSINWNTKNSADDQNETQVSITKNEVELHRFTTTIGMQTVTPEVPVGLRDRYVVSAKSKNADDSAWSYDSYIQYVYNKDALAILVNGQKTTQGKVSLDNNDWIKELTSQEILELDRSISLLADTNLDTTGNAFSVVADQVYWGSSDSGIASLNYAETGTLHNIEDYGTKSYMPLSVLTLAGLKNGTATLTATHKLVPTLQNQVSVDVSTLKNKLYLIALSPKCVTDVTYTDGKGQLKTTKTDRNGALAIYEESGIADRIQFKTTYDDTPLDGTDNPVPHMGTLFVNAMTSGEGDGSKGELYPVNQLRLRKPAEVKLIFQMPAFEGYQNNGDSVKPFTGKVTLRGGVYRNGVYCPSAKLPGNVDVLSFTPDAKGMKTLTFDPTQFIVNPDDKEINSADKIDYIFEAKYLASGESGQEQGTKYYPTLLNYSGSYSDDTAMRMGDNTILLRPTQNDANKPFVVQQQVNRFKQSGRIDDVTQFKGNVGINIHTPKILLTSTALWWGQEGADEATWKQYKLDTVYDRSKSLPGLTTTTFKYPFSTIPVSQTQTTLSEETIWLKASSEKGLTANLFYDAKGNLMRSANAPYILRNLMDLGDITQDDQLNGDFKQTLMDSMKASASVDERDKLVAKALDFAGNMEFDSNDGSFKMLLSPTKDPGVFDALVQLRVGQDLDDAMGLNIPKDGFSGIISEEDGQSFSAKETAKFAKKAATTAIQEIRGDETPEILYQIGGLIKAKIVYDFDTAQWSVQPVGGGIDAGVGIKFGISIPIKLAPIPIQVGFVDINMGASVALSYRLSLLTGPKTVTYSSKVNTNGLGRPDAPQTVDYDWENKQADQQIDHLTNLKINAFIEVFGGLGFDYTILALKLGPFGGVGLKNENAFLNRGYLDPKFADEELLTGSLLNLVATVGIKFEGTFIGITYTKVLCSKTWDKTWTYTNWQKIAEYWYATTGESLTGYTPDSVMGRRASAAYADYTGEMAVYDGGALPESRGYLSENQRIWNSATEVVRNTRSLDVDSNGTPKAVLTNAYPNAGAKVSGDGALLVLLDDQGSVDTTDTRIAFSSRSASGYEIPTPIDNQGYGDNSPALAGTKSFAAASWVRLSQQPPVHMPNEPFTPDQQNAMINDTEIMASIYDGTNWVTTPLTNNKTPDLAPSVAVGEKSALVAWRGTLFTQGGALAEGELPYQFGTNDLIQYRTYNKETSDWSATQVLYDATTGGKVTGLSTAVMDDGTLAIAYSFDSTESQEIVCTILDATGTVKTSTRVTNNSLRDENPQLAVVNFASSGQDDWRFVLGWNHQGEQIADVELVSFDKNGNLKDDLAGSIAQMSGGTPVPDLFQFAAMAGANRTLDNLTIIWTESANDGNTIGSDKLKAVQFVLEGTKVHTSAPMPLADLPQDKDKGLHTIADSVSGYVSTSRQVKALIMATEYDSLNPVQVEVEVLDDDDALSTEMVPVPSVETFLYSATQDFKNIAQITAALIDPTEIDPEFPMPISITLRNNGMDPLLDAKITIDGTEYVFSNLNLYPGLSKTVTALHVATDITADLAYSGVATFATGDHAMEGSGVIPVAVPDLGIAKAEVITAKDGVRNVAVSLYNAASYKLANTGKTVKVGLFAGSGYEQEHQLAALTLSNSDLELLDLGAYTGVLRFDLKQFLGMTNGVQNEIPNSGLPFFLKVWTEETVVGTTQEVVEYFPTDNTGSVHFESPKANNNGKLVSISLNQGEAPDQNGTPGQNETVTTADLTLSSNVMAQLTNGNAVVNLLDKNGNVLESKLLSESPLNLTAEQVVNKPFTFSQRGARVEASYFTAAAPDVSEAALSMLDISNHDIAFNKDVLEYELATGKQETTLQLTAVATSQDAVLTIKGKEVTSENGRLTCEIPASGKVELAVTNGDLVTTYTINLTQAPGGGSQPNTYLVNASAGEGGTISPMGKILVAEDSKKTFTIKANQGYEIADVTVNGVSVGAVSTYEMTKVKGGMTIHATFKKLDLWVNPYIDVPAQSWFYQSVKAMSQQGLMKGVSDDRFAPLDTTTRAMAMTMLYRQAGSPAVQTDETQWYGAGRQWAIENGISDGTNPQDTLTREQLVTILYRYAKGTPGKQDDLAAFTDGATVSSFAKDAMSWAVEQGILQGNEGKLNPLSSASRAEVATIFTRFQTILKP